MFQDEEILQRIWWISGQVCYILIPCQLTCLSLQTCFTRYAEIHPCLQHTTVSLQQTHLILFYPHSSRSVSVEIQQIGLRCKGSVGIRHLQPYYAWHVLQVVLHFIDEQSSRHQISSGYEFRLDAHRHHGGFLRKKSFLTSYWICRDPGQNPLRVVNFRQISISTFTILRRNPTFEFILRIDRLQVLRGLIKS